MHGAERPLSWVTDREGLNALAAGLSAATRFAVDTEANGFHRYHERVCLVQLSTDDRDWLIDPLAVPDLSALCDVFADTAITKVLHGADYDVIGLRRDFGLELRGLFDTMLAARLTGRREVSLRALLRDLVGVSVDKQAQRADWTVRPLPPDLVAYARGDTRYLLGIAGQLEAGLVARKRLDAAHEEFQIVESRVQRGERFGIDGWAREPEARRMTPRERGGLRALWEWRDRTASRRDLPPFRVLRTEALVALARRFPTNVDEVARTPGVGSRVARSDGPAVIEALAKARPEALPPREPDGRKRQGPLMPAQRLRYEALRAWRAAAAAQRVLEPGLLASNDALHAIACLNPADAASLESVPELRRWQAKELGPELLAVLDTVKA